MRVMIVDDERPALDRLSSMVDGSTNYQVCASAQNGIEAIRAAEEHKPDIALMDIRMPGMDGLEAARHLSQMEEPPAIIFTTAFGEHALEAFDTLAVGYLLKPIRQEKLSKALEKAGQLNRVQLSQIAGDDGNARKHICARVRGNLELIPLTEIFYFQADQKYVTVRHAQGEVLIEEPLKALEDEFTENFMRIHRNALVAKTSMTGMTKTTEGRFRLTMKDIDDTLEISRRHVAEVRRFLKGN
ncbi:MAG TPA: DNA-binding response regulator [Gammaproteobacteria bacterium]|nr:DNA-binding response regulator [Gammaproteobacteria bacterium]